MARPTVPAAAALPPLLLLLALLLLQAHRAAAQACTGTSAKTSTAMTGGSDHQAHAVAGDAYTKVDFEGDGTVLVELDGSRSHSHFFDPATKLAGIITSYQWKANGKVIGTTAKLPAVFPVGKTVVTLTVVDNLNDTACDTAVVTGISAQTTGAFCYFYPGLTALGKVLNVDPKPEAGVRVPSINFPDLASFPFEGKAAPTWTMRCTGNLNAGPVAAGSLALARKGRVAAYLTGNDMFAAEGPGTGGTGVVPINSAFNGSVPLNLVYHKSGPAAQFQLLLAGKPVPESALSFSGASVLPIVTGISPATAEPEGGGQMQIFGQGFVNKVRVYVGKFKADAEVTSTKQILVTVPTQAQAGGPKVIVYVGNNAGESNNKPLTYVSGGAPPPPAPGPGAPAAPGGGAPVAGGGDDAPPPKGSSTIKWTNTFFKKADGSKASIPLLTSVALGPDFNYYFGSQDGFVYKITAGKNLIITSQCKSFSMGQARSVLGIAFNPLKKAAQPYITTSTIFRKSSRVNTPLKNKVDGWANGNVETLIPGCGCFCSKKIIISGLPVSHHDHAVNKIQFLNNGDMLISVAGTTNGGDNTPNNLLGGLEESPLSAAILLAKTSKGDNIDGAIKYNQYVNPNKAFKLGGADVSVYATGLRNCFGMTQTRSGKIYATDNGANKGFGFKSTSCTSQVPFDGNIKDELNLIVKGGHYGHPNRNRGRTDSKQCVWGSGIKAATTFQSSTDGIIEYVSNAFAGNMKGDLVSTQYSTVTAGFQGAATRIQLLPNGQVQNQYKMATYSGVAAENGLYGEVVMPRVGKAMVAVLKPVYTAPSAPYVVAVTPKIGFGGQQILVAGDNFKPGLKAFVGGKPCTKVSAVGANEFKCFVPPGAGLVGVDVINPDGAKSAKFGGDFLYA